MSGDRELWARMSVDAEQLFGPIQIWDWARVMSETEFYQVRAILRTGHLVLAGRGMVAPRDCVRATPEQAAELEANENARAQRASDGN